MLALKGLACQSGKLACSPCSGVALVLLACHACSCSTPIHACFARYNTGKTYPPHYQKRLFSLMCACCRSRIPSFADVARPACSQSTRTIRYSTHAATTLAQAELAAVPTGEIYAVSCSVPSHHKPFHGELFFEHSLKNVLAFKFLGIVVVSKVLLVVFFVVDMQLSSVIVCVL